MNGFDCYEWRTVSLLLLLISRSWAFVDAGVEALIMRSRWPEMKIDHECILRNSFSSFTIWLIIVIKHETKVNLIIIKS